MDMEKKVSYQYLLKALSLNPEYYRARAYQFMYF